MAGRDDLYSSWGPGGLRQRSHVRLDDTDAELQSCLDTVGRRIAGTLGVAIENWGRLREPYFGYPEDTEFVEISADCLDEKVSARRALEDVAGLTELAWDYGWETKAIRGRAYLTLRVFPRSR